jgi:hypothetical protein
LVEFAIKLNDKAHIEKTSKKKNRKTKSISNHASKFFLEHAGYLTGFSRAPQRPLRWPETVSAPQGNASGASDETRSKAGTHLAETTSRTVSRLLFLVAPSLPRLPPLHGRSMFWPSRQKIPPASDTAVMTGSLAVVFAAAASPTRPRTRRQTRPSYAHRRCLAVCLVGPTRCCSLPPLPRMKFNHLFCFSRG